MRKIFSFCLILVSVCLYSYGQESADARIGELINQQKWHQLRDYYESNSEKIMLPLIDNLARFFISYTSNDMPAAADAAMTLLEKHSGELGESLFSTYYLASDSFMQMGQYDKVLELTDSFRQAYTDGRFVPDDGIYAIFDYFRNYAEYCIAHGGEMLYEPSGNDESVGFTGSGAIILDGRINGDSHKLLFDTGAGANLMLRSYADKIGLKPVEGLGVTVSGLGKADAGIVFADSVSIGNMLFRNVPFYIFDADTGHEKTDSALNTLGPVIGQPFIKKMKEVRIDFRDSIFTVPAEMTRMPFSKSNLCYTLSQIFDFTVSVGGEEINLNFDTGSAKTTLDIDFYNRFKEYVESVGILDSLCLGGIGGWLATGTYCIPEFHYCLADGREFQTDSVHVSIDKSLENNHEGAYGVESCAENRMLIINVKDMFIDLIPDIDHGLQADVELEDEYVIPLSGNVSSDRKPPVTTPSSNVNSTLRSPTIETRFVNKGGAIEPQTSY